MTAAETVALVVQAAPVIGAVVGGYIGGRRGSLKVMREQLRTEVAAGIAQHEQRCREARAPSPILTPSGRWPLGATD